MKKLALAFAASTMAVTGIGTAAPALAETTYVSADRFIDPADGKVIRNAAFMITKAGKIQKTIWDVMIIWAF